VEHCRRLWTQSFDQPRKTFEAGFASLAEGLYRYTGPAGRLPGQVV